MTLTLVNPNGQQQSSSISSGFVSNMLNLNQDTSVDAIFGHNAEATSLIDIPVTAIAKPSFFAPMAVTGIQLLGLKALEDNFSEFKQTNQYAEALSSIPGIVDQYLANKMKEVVDVAVQLKSNRIREEAQVENQQFLDSIDEGMKKLIKEQPDMYRSNLRRRDAYTPYSDPRGFIYENKDKNRLMRIDELHKFSNGTLDDVRTALNDRLKGIKSYDSGN
ncbi:hypothetical protein Tco_1160051 [Tanacetum coccineum]